MQNEGEGGGGNCDCVLERQMCSREECAPLRLNHPFTRVFFCLFFLGEVLLERESGDDEKNHIV